jgi:hypothetical protein
MTGTSAAGLIVMCAVIVVALAVMIGLVLFAVRHPHWKNPKIDTKPGDVRGGVFVGDPHSVAPRRDEPVNPPEELAGPERVAVPHGRFRPARTFRPARPPASGTGQSGTAR